MAPYHRTSFAVGPLGSVCTILVCERTNQGLVVDPGDEAPRILKELRRLKTTLVGIVYTHTHFDHILGGPLLWTETKAPIIFHRGDLWLYENVEIQTRLLGFEVSRSLPAPDRFIVDGDTLTFGECNVQVMHTPGHTPGSVCLFLDTSEAQPLLLAGDTLFSGGIGRTDLWGGSFDALVRSVRESLFELPPETVVVPGHGPETTIAFERTENPFVGGRAAV
jgi:hydroxyacylglutathione hydrolase